jgi:hypothetical protein
MTLVLARRSPLPYVDHVAATGTALFQAVCERDMEGIVAKLARGAYTPEETTWVKIRNPASSQVGRAEFFDGRAFRAIRVLPAEDRVLPSRNRQRKLLTNRSRQAAIDLWHGSLKCFWTRLSRGNPVTSDAIH